MKDKSQSMGLPPPAIPLGDDSPNPLKTASRKGSRGGIVPAILATSTCLRVAWPLLPPASVNRYAKDIRT